MGLRRLMGLRGLALHVVLGAFFAQLQPASAGYQPPTKFLIISNARNGTIAYTKAGPGNLSEPHILVSSGLGHPQGIAVDQKRQLLFVADSDLKKVVSYGLSMRDGELVVDEQTPVAENVESRWVAVDGNGNVYISDELQNQVLRVSARQVLDGDTSAKVAYAREASSSLYQQPSTVMTAISAPGGIAVDNFYVYWANKQDGDTVGTVVKHFEVYPNSSLMEQALQSRQSPAVLAKNTPKAYGVCIAMDNVYYTDSENNVYVVKRSGGDPVTVTSDLQSPRGCTWDGDSTIYVADRTAGGIFAISGPRSSLTQTEAQQVLNFEDAFGVAMFSSSLSLRPWVATLFAPVFVLLAAV